ncbi:hypothetical protein GJ744_009297 [Endocarpon pusillum]|uniref:F-box domain-containing protein n=1 Tax=Endocarpon pusillum TaxID=364733 RepID=A0A8H7AJA2_9EURO|nr:hypothetical protein GJ744_009297 [Endocarpon pusillum]
MGSLAYESSNSLTARLLGRVKGGLETFIAPAKTFSLNGFIPLSKCQQLRQISLYSMFDSFRVDQVLRPFRQLKQLRAFAFPRSTDFRSVHDITEIPWPPNLQRVTLSGFFPSRSLFSKSFLRDWPPSLRHVILDNACGLRHLYSLSDVYPNMPYTILAVDVTTRNCLHPPINMALACSGVKLLSLPADLAITNYSSCRTRPVLERLDIRRKAKAEPHQLMPSDLLEHAEGIPTLLQICLHSYHVDDEDMDFKAADTLLKSRAQVRKREDGTMAIEPHEAGVIVFWDD